jgi:predicted short-subunit dehydrogenase-like oxidoreductase (DUF2520 family)
MLLLQRAGHQVVGASNATAVGAAETLRLTGLTSQVSTCPALPEACEVVWICTPDAAIAQAASALHGSGQLSGRFVLHASGSAPSWVLMQAAPAAAGWAGLHPLYPFSDPSRGSEEATRAAWFLEGSPAAEEVAKQLLAPLGISPHPLAPGDRTLYHAAAVVASNAVVALMAMARDLLVAVGQPPRAAEQALMPLAFGALANVRAQGAERALTGPIARGDVEVVRAHVEALAARTPEWEPVYRALAVATLRTARAAGAVSEQSAEALERVLLRNLTPPS